MNRKHYCRHRDDMLKSTNTMQAFLYLKNILTGKNQVLTNKCKSKIINIKCISFYRESANYSFQTQVQ